VVHRQPPSLEAQVAPKIPQTIRRSLHFPAPAPALVLRIEIRRSIEVE